MRRDPSTAPKHFITAFLCWTFLPVVLIGLFNLLVDPLHLLPFDGIAGINAHKPMLRDHERLFKPYAVSRMRPEAVILGSSRSNHALDPNHPAWHGLKTFNFSVSGTTIGETRALFEDAVATGAVKLAVIELDMGFFDNTADRSELLTGYLSTPGHTNHLGPVLTLLRTAFAWNTLRLSLGTLSGQRDDAEYTALGRQTDRVFRWRIASYGGVRRTFEGYMERLASDEQQQAVAWTTARVTDDGFPGMEDLGEIIRLASARHIKLMLYISPTHALDQEAVRTIYGWNLLEDWKRALVGTVDRERRAALAQQPPAFFDVQLWDFSGYNSVTTEPIPALSDSRAEMSYYWDQSHYRLLVGDWVLDRMFGINSSNPPAPSDFGIRLSADNMEQHFLQTRAAAESYRLSHASESAFVRQLARDATTTP